MKTIQEKIDSAEYKVKLEDTLVSIMTQVSSARTEASVASRFETNLYFFIKDFFKREIVFDKEEGKVILGTPFLLEDVWMRLLMN